MMNNSDFEPVQILYKLPLCSIWLDGKQVFEMVNSRFLQLVHFLHELEFHMCYCYALLTSK